MVQRTIIDDFREKMLQAQKEDPFWAVFGLKESPFQVADNIDAKYFYESPKHKELIDKLQSYIIKEAAYIYAVTGLAGVGKTFTYNVFANRLITQQSEFRRLMREEGYTEEQIKKVPTYQTIRFQNTLQGEHGEQVNVSSIKKYMLQHLNPSLKKVLEEYDVFENHHHQEKVHNIWLETMSDLAKRNEVMILFIDEAQGLSLDLLKAIRVMTGINETILQHGLTIVYIGTTELLEKLNSDDAIRSRINEHFLLEPLNEIETGEMIRFRLSVASKTRKMTDLIPNDVIHMLHAATGGVPRSIFQKLSSAFRLLMDKHVAGDPHVNYLDPDKKAFPILSADILQEILQRDRFLLSPTSSVGEGNDSHILKMSDDQILQHIEDVIRQEFGFLEIKVSQNAWIELADYIRNQVLTLDEVIQDIKLQSEQMASRYTIQKAKALYKRKLGETP